MIPWYSFPLEAEQTLGLQIQREGISYMKISQELNTGLPVFYVF